MNLPFTVFAGYDYIYELSQCLYSIPCHLFFSWLVYMESRKTHSVSLEINSFFFLSLQLFGLWGIYVVYLAAKKHSSYRFSTLLVATGEARLHAACI